MTRLDARSRVRVGFTLVELLVVVSVIGILIGVLLPAIGHARECALMAGELSAGRQFATGHALYTEDYSGFVMPGYPSAQMMQRGDVIAEDNLGNRLTGLEGRRYPWRLLPYFDYDLKMLYLDRAEIEALTDGLAYQYAVSVAPRMGLNQAFVGGSSEGETGRAFLENPRNEARLREAWGPNWYVRRLSAVRNPSLLLAFASSEGEVVTGEAELSGFYRVTPPSFRGRLWTEEEPGATTGAGETGNVAFRYLEKTVAAMLDGHAETLDWGEAQDMRRWAPTATSPEWTLPPL